jgi:hypothetical protein
MILIYDVKYFSQNKLLFTLLFYCLFVVGFYLDYCLLAFLLSLYEDIAQEFSLYVTDNGYDEQILG